MQLKESFLFSTNGKWTWTFFKIKYVLIFTKRIWIFHCTFLALHMIKQRTKYVAFYINSYSHHLLACLKHSFKKDQMDYIFWYCYRSYCMEAILSLGVNYLWGIFTCLKCLKVLMQQIIPYFMHTPAVSALAKSNY